jgi:hypothetical protein
MINIKMDSTSAVNYDVQHDYESLLNDVSRQMATSQLSRRNSRSSKRHSATPSRRSIRVEKPPTAHNSPRVPERRRTTSAVNQSSGVYNQYNMMYGDTQPDIYTQMSASDKNIARPYSWHPSASATAYPRDTMASAFRYSANIPTVPSVPAIPLAWNQAIESSLQGAETSMDHSSATTMPTSYYDAGFQGEATSLWDQFAAATMWSQSSYFDPCPATDNAMYLSDVRGWSQDDDITTSMAARDTADETADNQNSFLPIQDPDSLQDNAQPILRSKPSKESSKSLIGMGLYDEPDEPTPNWRSQLDGRQTWPVSEIMQGNGKGLKLEECFEPPPDHGDDEPEDDEDDAGSSEDDVQEEDPANIDEAGVHVTVASHPPTNLAGQSFFFEDDEQYNTDWWYAQGKGLPTQPPAVGYGWI